METTTTDDRSQLVSELMVYANASKSEAARVLSVLEKFWLGITPGKLPALIALLSDLTTVPRPAVALCLYHLVALADTREGAVLLFGAAVKAAVHHGISDTLLQQLHAHLEMRGVDQKGH